MASGTAAITLFFNFGLLRINSIKLSIRMYISFSQSNMKPFELKSVFSGFAQNKYVRAVHPLILDYRPNRCTSLTAQSCLSICGFQ